MVTHFVDDEDGYLAWLAGHPTGFVVNCYRNPTPSYVILHRADCSSFSRTGVRWTHIYRKVCGGSRGGVGPMGAGHGRHGAVAVQEMPAIVGVSGPRLTRSTPRPLDSASRLPGQA
jgi:hypothetical protein